MERLNKSVIILGIPFFNTTFTDCFIELNNFGGLLTVPSGPGLANIPNDKVYYEALLNSDLVIPDSGYMVLIWRLISRKNIKRLSGLGFINHFFEQMEKGLVDKVFLVNPSDIEGLSNQKVFNSFGLNITENDMYTAPFYTNGAIKDDKLCQILKDRKPKWIFLNIGGGVQEILGLYLKNNLDYRPAIICTGAAIAFKTGHQVKIPNFADKLYIGWLIRILSNPKVYLKRYWEALSLFNLLLKYQGKKFTYSDHMK